MERWYLATLLSLILHQIDAAFWHEWDMFRMPGGIQGFLVFNLVAVGVLLHGYRQVALAKPSAGTYALICGTIGMATGGIHVLFAVAGREEFHLPLSITMLAACLFAGAGLVLTTLRRRP